MVIMVNRYNWDISWGYDGNSLMIKCGFNLDNQVGLQFAWGFPGGYNKT